MKRFRIEKTDKIQIDLVLNRTNILPSLQISGFSKISDLINNVKQNLDYSIKGKGKRIEIGINNLTKNQKKYIDTFS
jgi:hypothetical protein